MTNASLIAERFRRNVEEHLKCQIAWGNLVFNEDITDEMLERMRDNFAHHLSDGEQPVVYFRTSFRSGKRGLLCTDQGLHWWGPDKRRHHLRYGQVKSVFVGARDPVLFVDRPVRIGGSHFNIPFGLDLAGVALLSCLQDAIGHKPEIPLMDLRSQIESDMVIARKYKVRAYLIITIATVVILVILAVMLGVVVVFIANPRLLAPIGVGIGAMCHSANRNWNRLTVFIDLIVWIVLTCMMFSWIIEGF